MADKKFDLEHQYYQYLKKICIEEGRMGTMQKDQLKQMFMAACGLLLILIRDDVGALDEDKGVEVLEDMVNQVADFFLAQTHKQN